MIGGEASFSGLTLNKVGVGYTLKVTSGNLTSDHESDHGDQRAGRPPRHHAGR